MTFRLAKELIAAHMLEEIQPEGIRKKAPSGAVLIGCGDRDRFSGFFVGCTAIIPIHPIALNGGGLLLGDDIDETRRQIILEDCTDALRMKQMNFVFILSHFPCGKATALGIGLRDTILKTLEGKRFLKKHLHGVVHGVLPLISIDWRGAGIEGEDGIKIYATHLHKADTIASFDPPRLQSNRHIETGTRMYEPVDAP